MPKATSFRIIQAPLETVFDVVAHVENFPKAVPEITQVEVLTEIKNGIGTRFRETRDIEGRIVCNEIDVTDYDLNKFARTVFTSGNIVWDSIFKVTPHTDGTYLTLEMVADPQDDVALEALTPMMELISAHVETDMDAIKSYCERIASD